MSNHVGSYEAKTKLPELLRSVAEGQQFTLTNRGKPIAELVPTRQHVDYKTEQAIANLLENTVTKVPDSLFKKLLDESGR